MRRAHFKFIDLFAGVGGFHHALAAEGGECVMACEIDEDCRKVYRQAFPELDERMFPSDIRSLTRLDPADENSVTPRAKLKKLVPAHDVLCGGFPCQPFSKSGAQLGIEDKTRGTLFFDIMQIVAAHKPQYLILENVRNLAGPRHTETWKTIVQAIRNQGYLVADEPVVLSPHLASVKNHGAPQVRDRVFILAERKDMAKDKARHNQPLLDRSIESGWHPDRWAIREFLSRSAEPARYEKYSIRKIERAWIDAWNSFVKTIPADHLPGFPIWAFALRERNPIPSGCPDWKRSFLSKNQEFYRQHSSIIDRWLRKKWGAERLTVLQFPESRQKFEWQARKHQPTRSERDLAGLVLQLRPSGIRVKPPSYLPALVAITQTSILGPDVTGGSEYRRLMPEEAAMLQDIPWEPFESAGVMDSVAYRQLGNAVNVGVVRRAFRVLYGNSDTHLHSTVDEPLLFAGSP